MCGEYYLMSHHSRCLARGRQHSKWYHYWGQGKEDHQSCGAHSWLDT